MPQDTLNKARPPSARAATPPSRELHCTARRQDSRPHSDRSPTERRRLPRRPLPAPAPPPSPSPSPEAPTPQADPPPSPPPAPSPREPHASGAPAHHAPGTTEPQPLPRPQ